MSELKQLLDRAADRFVPDEHALERALRRYERRQRHRRALSAVVAISVCVAAAMGLWTTFRPGRPEPGPQPVVHPTPTAIERNGRIEIVRGTEPPPVPFVAGENIIGLPNGTRFSLERPARSPLTGWIAATAVFDPRRATVFNSYDRTVIYNSWRSGGGPYGGSPEIRLHVAGSDTVLAKNAYTFALAQDGRFAYFDAYIEELGGANGIWNGNVVVGRLRPDGTFEQVGRPWTAGRWTVLGWAGDYLLALARYEGGGHEVFAFKSPKGRHRLGGHGNTELIAISPEGGRAAITYARGDGGTEAVQIVDVATGRTVASFNGWPNGPEWVMGAHYSGDWTGDSLVVGVGHGFAVFRVGDDIRLERRVSLGRYSMYEPRFVGSSSRVVGWTTIGMGHAYVDCDLEENRCVVGPTVPFKQARTMDRVYNPSRPLPDTE